MSSDSTRVLLAGALLLVVAGCAEKGAVLGPPLSVFGEANRHTLAAQIIDPDPQYETLDPATSAEHAAQAVERYRKDQVKRPERVSSRTTGGSN